MSTYGDYWHKVGSWFGSFPWLSSLYPHCSCQSMTTAPLCRSILCFTPALIPAGRDRLAPCFVPSSLPALFPPPGAAHPAPAGILLLRVQAACPSELLPMNALLLAQLSFPVFSPVKAALNETGNQNYNVCWKLENKSLCSRVCTTPFPAPRTEQN